MVRSFRRTLVAAVISGAVLTAGITAAAQAILRFTDTVAAFGTDRWIHFLDAGYHRLEVQGDNDTDLDCWVSDLQGNLLGSDTDETDYCIIRWYQPRGKRLNFRIDNLGGVYNRYEFRLY